MHFSPICPSSDEASSRIVTDSVAVTLMIADLVLHQYFSGKRQPGFGSGNCHGAEVLCRIFIWTVDTGMFL